MGSLSCYERITCVDIRQYLQSRLRPTRALETIFLLWNVRNRVFTDTTRDYKGISRRILDVSNA